VSFDRRAGYYFLRLADFFGFVGLMSEILRIMASNCDGCFWGCVFTLLATILPLF
jgi:hypothetical protein